MKSFWLLPIAASAAALCWAGAVGHIRSQDSSNPLAEFAARAQPFSRGEADAVEKNWKAEQTNRETSKKELENAIGRHEELKETVKDIQKEIELRVNENSGSEDWLKKCKKLINEAEGLKGPAAGQPDFGNLRNSFENAKDLVARKKLWEDWQGAWKQAFEKPSDPWFKVVADVNGNPQRDGLLQDIRRLDEDFRNTRSGKTDPSPPP